MIRLFLFSRPLPHVTREQFQYSLLYDHAPLVKNCPGFVRPTKGYMQNHFAAQLGYEAESTLLREPRFDNCSEFWYDRIENILESYNNDDYVRMLRPDENGRTDKATRVALIAEEKVVYEHSEFRSATLMPKVVVLAGSQAGDAGKQRTPRAETRSSLRPKNGQPHHWGIRLFQREDRRRSGAGIQCNHHLYALPQVAGR